MTTGNDGLTRAQQATAVIAARTAAGQLPQLRERLGPAPADRAADVLGEVLANRRGRARTPCLIT